MRAGEGFRSGVQEAGGGGDTERESVCAREREREPSPAALLHWVYVDGQRRVWHDVRLHPLQPPNVLGGLAHVPAQCLSAEGHFPSQRTLRPRLAIQPSWSRDARGTRGAKGSAGGNALRLGGDGDAPAVLENERLLAAELLCADRGLRLSGAGTVRGSCGRVGQNPLVTACSGAVATSLERAPDLHGAARHVRLSPVRASRGSERCAARVAGAPSARRTLRATTPTRTMKPRTGSTTATAATEAVAPAETQMTTLICSQSGHAASKALLRKTGSTAGDTAGAPEPRVPAR